MAALRLLKKSLLDIKHREAELWQANNDTSKKSDTPPQLIIDNFCFEELHHVMKRNGSQVLGLFDEISTLYMPNWICTSNLDLSCTVKL